MLHKSESLMHALRQHRIGSYPEKWDKNQARSWELNSSQALGELGGAWAPSSQSNKPAKCSMENLQGHSLDGESVSLWQKLFQIRPKQV